MKNLKIIILLVLSIFYALFSTNTFADLSISPLKFEFDIDKNSQTKEKIKVTNRGEEAITIYSSKEDFVSGDDSGTPKFVKPEDAVDSNHILSNWITVEDKNLTLAPGESKEVNFTIKVPASAEPGGHYSAIFFSPGVPNGGQVAVVQRLGVLVLVNVPGEVKIEGNLKSFKIGELDEDKKIVEKEKFENFPITFQTIFENTGNVHIKPTGKITLLDENGETLKNIGKRTLSTPAGAYIGEELVDFIPINDTSGNVLPKSERRFEINWEGFGYTVLNNDGTKSVLFKNLTDYYADKASENAQYLMFWQKINSRKVDKKVKAVFDLSYEGKDKVKKEFKDSKEFTLTYEEKYVGMNYFVVFGSIIFIIGVLIYFIIIAPRQRAKRDEELKRRLMEELKNHKE